MYLFDFNKSNHFLSLTKGKNMSKPVVIWFSLIFKTISMIHKNPKNIKRRKIKWNMQIDWPYH